MYSLFSCISENVRGTKIKIFVTYVCQVLQVQWPTPSKNLLSSGITHVSIIIKGILKPTIQLTICSQCTISLPPENIRKPYGFQGIEKGCIGNEQAHLSQVNVSLYFNTFRYFTAIFIFITPENNRKPLVFWCFQTENHWFSDVFRENNKEK